MFRFQYPFSIYRKILKDDDLHFGLWDKGIDDLEKAQQNLNDLIFSSIPGDTEKILDVGCGFGKLSYLLARKGYRVIGLDPDEGKILYCKQKYDHENVSYFAKSFLENDLEKTIGRDFDLILFCESTQYFDDLKNMFEKCRSILRDGGYVLFCDEIDYIRNESAPVAGVKNRNLYIVSLSEAGFRVVFNKKLGKMTRKTCEVVLERLSTLPQTDEVKHLLEGWADQNEKHGTGRWGYELFKAKKDCYFMSGYRAGMENEILDVFTRVFQVSRSMDHWRWKYLECPFGNKAVAVCLDSSANKIVAQFSGYYVEVEDVNKREVFSVLQVGDTMTVPEVRGVGLGKTSIFGRTGQYFFARYCRGKMPYVYGFATGTSLKLGRLVLGYDVVCPVGYFKKKTCNENKLFRKSLKRLFYSVREIDSFDAGYDKLYKKIKKQYGGMLIKRDCRYLNWRFKDPDKNYKLLELKHRIVGLVGYMIVDIKDDIATIGDIFVDRRYLYGIEKALFLLVNRYKIKEISLWLSERPSWLVRYFSFLGFEKQDEPFDLSLLIVSFDPDYHATRIKEEYFYTRADSDLF